MTSGDKGRQKKSKLKEGRDGIGSSKLNEVKRRTKGPSL